MTKRKKKESVMYWTLVRHSSWTQTENPQFEFAVEEEMLTSEKEADQVRRAGGVVFNHYPQEEEYLENYPPDREPYGPVIHDVIPRVKGTFSKRRINGSEIYIPHPSSFTYSPPQAKREDAPRTAFDKSSAVLIPPEDQNAGTVKGDA